MYDGVLCICCMAPEKQEEEIRCRLGELIGRESIVRISVYGRSITSDWTYAMPQIRLRIFTSVTGEN